MKKSLLALASVLAIVAGCAKENLGEGIKARTHSGIKEISASLPSQTKTYLQQDEGGVYKFYWYPSENISAGADDTFLEFTLSEGENTPKGKFTSALDLPEAETYFAVSPQMSDARSNGDTLFFNYPSNLEYNPDSGCAEGGGEIMVARSFDENFAFTNAVGYINFKVNVLTEESVKKIEVSGKTGNRIAGPARVIFEKGETQLDTIKFATASEGGLATLTVDFPSGDVPVVPGGDPFSILIPVAPMKGGVSVTVTMASGKVATFTSSTPVFTGQLVEFPAVTFDPDPVAKVGENEYYSINSAILAANELGTDATVQLIADCYAGKDCEVISNKIITIDLAGYTLYSVGDNFFEVASGTAGCVIMDSSEGQTGVITNTNTANSAMKVYGPTTVKGGTIKGYYGINMVGGSLIIEGGTVQGSSTGIYCKNDGDNKIDSVVVKGGSVVSIGSNGILFNSLGANLIFRGGSLQSLKAGIYVYNGTLAIYGGNIGAKSNVIYGNRGSSYTNQIDIYGGFFHRDSTTNAIVYGHATTDTTRVWGGYYNVGPSVSYVPDGYEVGACDTTVNGITYTSTIIKSADVVCELQIGTGSPVQKGTVNEAFEAAKAQSEPATVKLLADCSTKDSIGMFNGHNFTLDLNGYTLTTAGTKVFHVNETGAVLTIKSSQEGGMMFESATGSNSLLVRGGGKVILESGCLKGNNATAGHMYIGNTTSAGEFIMNGGEIWTPDYSPVSLVNGTFTMNGGTLRTDAAETYCIKVNGGSAKFNGGSFVSKTSSYKIYVATEATIDGTFDAIAVSGAGKVSLTGGNYTGATRISASSMTITGGTFVNDTSQAIFVYSGGNVTISNATISGGSKYGSLRSLGSTTIEEGTTITSTNEEEGTAIYVGSDATSGSITVNSGKFSAYKTAHVGNGTLSIADGIFTSKQRALYVSSLGTAEIIGGYFNTPKDSVIFTGNGAKGMAKGGWYTQPLADSLINSAYILDNSKTTEKEGVTYSYQVIENSGAPDVASVNGANYKTIDAAITAAETAIATGNVTFKVLGDCSTLTSLDITGNNEFTLDLNGKELTAPVVSSVTSLKVTDNTTDALGVLKSSGRPTILLTGGTLTFDKGTIASEDSTGVFLNGPAEAKATFNMTGGKVEALGITFTGGNPGGAVIVQSNSEFNLSGGLVDAGSRAVYVRSYVDGVSSYFTMTGGAVRAAKYAVYIYTRGIINISDGIVIGGEGRVFHVATGNSGPEVNVTGGYYHSTTTTNFITGYNDNARSRYHISGGYYSADPVKASNNKIKLETGCSVTTVSPAIEKTVDGTTYSFGYQVTK